MLGETSVDEIPHAHSFPQALPIREGLCSFKELDELCDVENSSGTFGYSVEILRHGGTWLSERV
jgi:hypothetical protein